MRKPNEYDEEDSPADRALLFAVGKRIRELRRAKKLTQKELSELADVRANYIVEIEAVGANLSLKLVQRFADALNVPARDLFPSPEQTESPDVTISILLTKVANLLEAIKRLEILCSEIITSTDKDAAPDQVAENDRGG